MDQFKLPFDVIDKQNPHLTTTDSNSTDFLSSLDVYLRQFVSEEEAARIRNDLSIVRMNGLGYGVEIAVLSPAL